MDIFFPPVTEMKASSASSFAPFLSLSLYPLTLPLPSILFSLLFSLPKTCLFVAGQRGAFHRESRPTHTEKPRGKGGEESRGEGDGRGLRYEGVGVGAGEHCVTSTG